MKKKIALFLLCLMALSLFAGCGDAGQSKNDRITVISREDGSGTRGAFIELFGVEEKNEAGEKIDQTVLSSDITNSTSVMLTSVSQNPSAIGYISLGALNDTVKALEIDGAAPSMENVEKGSYQIVRPFNVASKGQLSQVAQDFLDFILSGEGQAVVAESGYIPVAEGAYSGTQPSGKVVVVGSSSVSPVMEKLKEAYLAINPNAQIELQTSDSTSGMNSTIEGICDLGMASRELKDSELEAGLESTVIAQDGIAVIVHPENSLSGLSAEQVKAIYTGAIAKWSELE